MIWRSIFSIFQIKIDIDTQRLLSLAYDFKWTKDIKNTKSFFVFLQINQSKIKFIMNYCSYEYYKQKIYY